MNEIEIIRKEKPPIAVSDLAGELEILSILADRWMEGGTTEAGTEAFRQIAARLHPRLLKALVLIAQKETSSALKNRKRTTLTCLGTVPISRGGASDKRQWLDVLVTQDHTPLLRRVEIVDEGISFHAATWAGIASITCAHADCWDAEKRLWAWDSADGASAVALLRDKVLPRLPLHMAAHEILQIPDWHRHLEYISPQSLLRALDNCGGHPLSAHEKAWALTLLEAADADLNPLWSHLDWEN